MAWAAAISISLLLSNGSFKLAISISLWQLSNGTIADSFKPAISISLQLQLSNFADSFKLRKTFRMSLLP